MLTMIGSGCAVNGVGFSTSDVIRANGAIVILTKTYGAALRTTAEDAGLAIGYTKTLAVASDFRDAPPVGSYSFGISIADLPVTAAIRRVVGVNLDANRQMVGVMLGVSEDAVLTRIPSNTSTARRLIMLPDDPARIELRLCQEPDACE